MKVIISGFGNSFDQKASFERGEFIRAMQSRMPNCSSLTILPEDVPLSKFTGTEPRGRRRVDELDLELFTSSSRDGRKPVVIYFFSRDDSENLESLRAQFNQFAELELALSGTTAGIDSVDRYIFHPYADHDSPKCFRQARYIRGACRIPVRLFFSYTTQDNIAAKHAKQVYRMLTQLSHRSAQLVDFYDADDVVAAAAEKQRGVPGYFNAWNFQSEGNYPLLDIVRRYGTWQTFVTDQIGKTHIFICFQSAKYYTSDASLTEFNRFLKRIEDWVGVRLQSQTFDAKANASPLKVYSIRCTKVSKEQEEGALVTRVSGTPIGYPDGISEGDYARIVENLGRLMDGFYYFYANREGKRVDFTRANGYNYIPFPAKAFTDEKRLIDRIADRIESGSTRIIAHRADTFPRRLTAVIGDDAVEVTKKIAELQLVSPACKRFTGVPPTDPKTEVIVNGSTRILNQVGKLQIVEIEINDGTLPEIALMNWGDSTKVMQAERGEE